MNDSQPRGEEVGLSPAAKDIAARGLPLTSQRRYLIDRMMSYQKPFTAEELLDEIQSQPRSIGRATVFRTLDLLVQLGHLHRLVEDHRAAYIACTPDHHHHLVCSNCGQVVHMTDCPIDGLLADLETRTGYQIERHRLEMDGVCPDCRVASGKNI